MINYSLFLDNILSPPILFFISGILAGLLKVELKIPASMSKFLSMYLMIAIGFKGGVAINELEQINTQIILTIITGVIVSFAQPFLAFFILKRNQNIDRDTAAAISANYGSISIITFIATTSILNQNNINYAGYIIAIVALMEFPAIISGLIIAKKNVTNNKTTKNFLLTKIVNNHTIFLMLSSFIIGYITGKPGLAKMEGLISHPFQGFLSLFLLDMGLLVSNEIEELKKINIKLILFGIYMPLIGATIGLCLSKILSLDLGTSILFIILCASASYIAVPAAMKSCLPKAKASIYMPMSIAITFPFNIVIGIPIYITCAKIFI